MIEAEGRTFRWIVLSIIFVAILVAADQWTKHLAVLYLKGRESRVLIDGVLEFRYLENQGAAFSMLQGQQTFFYILTAVFLCIAVYFFLRIPQTRRFLPIKICLLILMAGAAGNLIDRITHRYVVDFIYFSIIDFPVFNVADIYVSLSVIVLALLILFRYKDEDFSFLKKHSGRTKTEE